MKRYLKYIFLPLLCILTIIKPIKVNADSITLNSSNIMLGIGVTRTLQYSLGEGLNSNDIVWTSTDESIVVVENGEVTGMSEGTAIITAAINGKQSTCKVVVSPNYIKATGLKFNKSSATLLIGEELTLKATVSPSDTSNKEIVWTSSDPSIATVNSSGKISAKSIGTTIITASIDGHKATCQITVVYSLSLKGISLNKSNITIKEKATSQLTVTYNPNNATNKKVVWKSSNTNVAKVSSSGLVTAVAKGTATITVVSNDGGYVATCKVIVEEISKKVTSISLDKNELSMISGETTEIKATIKPDYAENKNIIWSSSNESLATVEDGKITALYPGEVEIKATSEDGEKEAICKVTITSPPLEAISFQEGEHTLYVGNEIILNPITTPEYSILENPIWISSNETVATVENGKVVAISSGQTIVTVSSQDGTKSASVNIIVIEEKKDPLNIIIEGYDLNFKPNILNYSLTIGDESELKITTNVAEEDIIIKGNQKLTQGSIITITYESDPKVTYIINIKKKENYTIYFIAAISALLLINLIRIIIKNKKKPAL